MCMWVCKHEPNQSGNERKIIGYYAYQAVQRMKHWPFIFFMYYNFFEWAKRKRAENKINSKIESEWAVYYVWMCVCVSDYEQRSVWFRSFHAS